MLRALRAFRRTPALVSAAVLTIGLGIGANTAIFSVIQAVLIKPLPYREPSSLVLIWEKNPVFGGFLADRLPVARVNFGEWKRQSATFAAMEALQISGVDVTGGDRPEEMQAARITPGFLGLLGREPIAGRNFRPEDGDARVVLLGYDFWKRRYDLDRQAIGRSIMIGGASYTIVGALPQDFHLPAMWQGMEADRPELWMPMTGRSRNANEDGTRDYYVFARLRPGVSLDAARAEMSAVAKRLETQYPKVDTGFSTSIWPLAVEDINPTTARTMIALQAAVGFVLLIACANVANLLLARAAGRGREMAIRAALGASRARLVRQTLGESLLLSAFGGALGIFFADLAMRAIQFFAPKDNYHFHEIALDWTVLAFAAAATVVSGLCFGLAPALAATAGQLRDALAQDGRAGSSRRAKRLRGALVVTEVAAALILLAGAGLMLRSLAAVLHVSPGFDPGHVLTAKVRLPERRYPNDAKRRQFCDELLDRAGRLPGVESASVSNALPMSDSLNVRSFHVDGGPKSQALETDVKGVSEDYFRTAGTPILRGRGFTRQDTLPEAHFIVVNEAFARRVFPGVDPLGRAIVFGEAMREQIVGVVPDSHEMGLEEPARPEIFLPTREIGNVRLMLRTKGDPAALTGALTAAVGAIDKDQAVSDIRSLAEHFQLTTEQRRFDTMLFGGLAGLALLLAAVGLYGVLSYSVALRTREIGVRMALGARARDVIAMVLRDGLALTLVGAAIGGGGAFALTRLMEDLVFGVSPSDPLTFVAVAATLGVVAVAACLVPARRAASVDPARSLRGD